MKRREFMTLLGGAAAALPVGAWAQQAAMPVVGFLNNSSPDATTDRLRAFRQGLKDTGYVEGENVAVEYRWAENQIDRLPALAADLARRRVAVLATFGNATAQAAKPVATTVPVVFGVGQDPVRLGLVASLARPGGNMTGINFLSNELTAKRLELLRVLVPGAVKVAVLVDPAVPPTETALREVEEAAGPMGLRNPDSQRQQQRRDRRGVRNTGARAARRALRRPRLPFHQPSGPIGAPGDVPQGPGVLSVA